jgi:hypothetical protein
MPAAGTASKESVNCPARSRTMNWKPVVADQELAARGAVADVQQEVADLPSTAAALEGLTCGAAGRA